jgi:hypothetical protein
VAQPPSETTAPPAEETTARFSVSLGNFDGPFDLLLSLIAKHEMDITDISLSVVTGEFIAYLRELDTSTMLSAGTVSRELDQASEFLVVAATLLDLKVAGLLPQGELVDAEDAALFEARDLLFARLLQYRAFKEATRWFSSRLDDEATRHYRSVRLEEKYRQQTPELVWTLTPDDFAALAALALAPREIPTVGLDHLHAAREHPGAGVARRRPAAASRHAHLPRAHRGRRREGRHRRALPRRARAVPPRGDRLRAARAARRAQHPMDRRALVGRQPRQPGV